LSRSRKKGRVEDGQGHKYFANEFSIFVDLPHPCIGVYLF